MELITVTDSWDIPGTVDNADSTSRGCASGFTASGNVSMQKNSITASSPRTFETLRLSKGSLRPGKKKKKRTMQRRKVGNWGRRRTGGTETRRESEESRERGETRESGRSRSWLAARRSGLAARGMEKKKRVARSDQSRLDYLVSIDSTLATCWLPRNFHGKPAPGSSSFLFILIR